MSESLESYGEDRVKIVYYTDPLCCWSWVLEPHWQKFQSEFKDKITVQYCMGGLIPNWDNYNDPMNSVSRPTQMGAIWMEAEQLTGVPVNYKIWIDNPPASSYPACIAVKAAGLQSQVAEECYLKAVREAVMLHGKDISNPQELVKIAESISLHNPGALNCEQFISDLSGEESKNAFRDDLQKVRYNRIGRFPTLTMSKPGQKGVILTGYRPYSVLLDALGQVDKSLLEKPEM